MNIISQTIPLQFDTIFSPFKASEFSYALEYVKEKGFTGVEIAVAYPAEVNTKKLIKELEKYNLTVTTLSTGQIYGLKGLFLSSLNEDIRKQAIKTVVEHIDLSSMLGYPPVTIGLIRGKLEKSDHVILLDNLKASLLECIEYACKRNVILQLEPINKSETVLINSTHEALSFLDSLGTLKIWEYYMIHITQIWKTEIWFPPLKAARKITNVHFCDSPWPSRYGTIDFHSV